MIASLADDRCICGAELRPDQDACSSECKEVVMATIDRFERRNPKADRRKTARGPQIPRTQIRLKSKDDRDSTRLVKCFGTFTGIEGLLEVALQRDTFTQAHVLHVNRIAATWLDDLGMSEDEELLLLNASLLHDLGKVVIPDKILMKPSSLTTDEYVEVQRHAQAGENILAAYPQYADVARVVGQHHEWFNGKGYPYGLAADEITTVARAVSVIDAYSAIRIDRPYHLGMSEEHALCELERMRGTQFDPFFVDNFVSMRRREKENSKRSKGSTL